MLHLTLESIIHGLLYIMTAALMFIVFTPRSLASTMKRRLLIIYGEVKKFQQCMLNIIKNGIEAMPECGKMTVQTELVRNEIQILVRDTGCGMSRVQVKRLGLPYYTTK